jgi:hypothetical protein
MKELIFRQKTQRESNSYNLVFFMFSQINMIEKEVISYLLFCIIPKKLQETQIYLLTPLI